MIIWVAIFFYMVLAALLFVVLFIKQGEADFVAIQLYKFKIKRISLIWWFTAFLLSPLYISSWMDASKGQLLDNLIMVIVLPAINYGLLAIVGMISTIFPRGFLVPREETEETLSEKLENIRLKLPTERDKTELLMMASSSVAVVIISILFFMLSHAPGGGVP